MKFVLALTVVALAAAGCGQNHGSQDRTTPPNSGSAITKASLDNALANLPGQSPDLSADNVALEIAASPSEESQPVQMADVSNLSQQIAFQQNMLFKEKAALDEAYANRDNSVHLPAAFVDMTAYGLATGLLSVDAYRGLKALRAEKGTSIVRKSKAAAEAEAEEAGLFSKLASRAASTATDVAPAAWRITEATGAVILGVYTIGKVVIFDKDVVVRVSDTNEIKYHRAKVEEAQKNLANAQANLEAVYYHGEKLPTP